VLFSYIKHEARNCMYGKLCGGLPSRNFGGVAKRGRSRYHASTPPPVLVALIADRERWSNPKSWDRLD
jgi:hypothetical protein